VAAIWLKGFNAPSVEIRGLSVMKTRLAVLARSLTLVNEIPVLSVVCKKIIEAHEIDFE